MSPSTVEISVHVTAVIVPEVVVAIAPSLPPIGLIAETVRVFAKPIVPAVIAPMTTRA